MLYFRYQIFQIRFITRNNNEVVSIPSIIFNFQIMFNKLIKFIHVNIGKNLRCKIANWYTSSIKRFGLLAIKLSMISRKSFMTFFILNSFFENAYKNIVVDRIKKLFNVAFQGITLTSIIFTYGSNHLCNLFHSFVRSLTNTTRERVRDKGRFKYGIKHTKNCMMEDTISNSRLMYTAQLWVMNPKPLIWFMLVRSIFQIPIEIKMFRSRSSSKTITSGLLRLSALNTSQARKSVLGDIINQYKSL